MKPNTQRGLDNAMSLLFSAAEFDTIRRFLLAEASAAKPETEEVIKYVCDEVRQHLITHAAAVASVKRTY
jgi:hypothetical protein